MSYIDDAEIDLTTCDREPIHRLGLIQPFGALIAVNSDWIVSRRSANTQELLELGEPLNPGDPLSTTFASQAIKSLRQRVALLEGTNSVQREFGIDLKGDGSLWDCAVHRAGDNIVIEIEQHHDTPFGAAIDELRAVTEGLAGYDGIADLCQRGAEQMKRLLGFDRVMVYRFHDDQSGEVIAEAREQHLESFLTLRYPKTDIPAQARELYKRNLFRIISDVRAEPVPIEPETRLDGDTLDLSLSTLRAVSPIHLEYLRNMGVDASLSISILVNGELWGLFACHHYSARTLPFSLRTVSELFAHHFALNVQLALDRSANEVARRGRELHDRLMATIAGGAELIESLPTIERLIGDVIPHDGSSVHIDGVYRHRGRAPNEEEFKAIVPALNTTAASRVFATDALAERVEKAAAFADRVVGALVIPVSRRPRDYLVLWRRELKQVVTWAGNPDKPVEHGKNGPRLTPRKSFAAWQETVAGKSSAWTDAELQIAESLRVSLLEIILKLTDDAVRERARAQERQELLIAELNHRVRNILNLIRGLIAQTGRETGTVEDFAETVGGRINALAIAHDAITRENWSPASLKELIENETEAYVGGKHDRVIVEGPDVMVSPQAYTVLALVLHEMITNSAKYGSLCDSKGLLTISIARDGHDDLTIGWRESGGPAVKSPERRGFGSTIIERSIPFELKGDAELKYKLGGVEAKFTIPGEFIEFVASDDAANASEKGSAAMSQMAGTEKPIAPDNVLLVEDSMIIALDTESMLRQLGARDVQVAGSVAQARGMIDKQMPDFALLDFNLGNETSAPIAQQLHKAGVPFCFATGYGEEQDGLTDSGAKSVLKKPYSKQDLADAMELALGAEAEIGAK